MYEPPFTVKMYGSLTHSPYPGHRKGAAEGSQAGSFHACLPSFFSLITIPGSRLVLHWEVLGHVLPDGASNWLVVPGECASLTRLSNRVPMQFMASIYILTNEDIFLTCAV